MSDIADFLRARYRQEAHVARLIAETTGSDQWKADWRQLSYNHFDARVVSVSGEPVFDGYGSVGTAEFVSGYSPARVLADIDAKLAIIDEHKAEEVTAFDTDGWERTGKACATCLTEDYPCRTLRLLAQPFAGHPDHKGEEWAP